MSLETYEVLLVEDNPRDAFALNQLLDASATTRFKILHVGTLAEGLRHLALSRHDILLLDLTLPDSRGLETLERARALARNIPIIIMSAMDDESIAIGAVRGGAQDYLLKGTFTTELVVRSIRYAIERFRTEEELRRSNQKLERLREQHQNILRNTPNGICMTNSSWQISYANHSMHRMFHSRASETEDLHGLPLSSFFRTDAEFRIFAADVREHLKSQTVFHQELAMQRTDGKALICHIYATRHAPNETNGGYLLTFSDVTDYKRAQLEREVFSRLGLEIAGVTSMAQLGDMVQAEVSELWDWTTFCIAVRTASAPVFETIRRVFFAHGGPQSLPRLRYEWSEVQLTRESFWRGQSELLRYPDDAPKPSLEWLPAGTGPIGCIMRAPVRVSGSVIGIIAVQSENPEQFDEADRDLLQRLADAIGPVLERCHAEAERARLAAAIEQSRDAVIVTDTDFRVEYANPAFEQMTGFSQSEVLGKRPTGVLGGDGVDDLWFDAIDETLLRGDSWSGRSTSVRKDGSPFEEEITVTPIRDSFGKIVNYVWVRRDITRETALENELRQAQKIEAIGLLAGGIAHDFNNILQVMTGNAELLLMRLQQGIRNIDPEDLETIIAAGRRGAGLTRQLLAFSRKQVMEPQLVNLADALRGVEKLLDRIIGEDIELDTDVATDLYPVNVDPGQIEQVLMNLCVNARDAMSNGGRICLTMKNVSVTDFVSSHHPNLQPGNYVLFSVSDTGCGMTAEIRERIFEPFYTTKEIGKGTGLGLSTVHGIVKQSGGEIFVTTEVGKGTTFDVYLPAADAVTTSLSEPTSSDTTAVVADKATVLIVEDEPGVRMVVKMVLEKNGYSILEASNGREALLVARHYDGEIHLLLSDVVMPEMGGMELAEEFHRLRPETSIIFMSGYTERALAAQEAGNAIPLLEKPFGPETLLEKVRLEMGSVRRVA